MVKLNISLLDRLLIVVSVLGVSVTGVLLYKDQILVSWVLGQQQGQEVVGKVGFARKDVRRRMGKSFIWYDVGKEDRLFANDSVFTGMDSETELVLDGLKLVLGPNSLIVLRPQIDSTVLDLQSGQVVAEVSNKKKLKLLQNGRVLGLDSESPKSRVQIGRSQSGALKFSNPSHDLNVEINGKKQKVRTEESIEITHQLEQKKSHLPVVLRQPQAGQHVWTAPDQPVTFRWRDTDSIQEPKRLQIARDKSFGEMVIDEPVSGNTFSVADLPEEGNYYWRINVDGKDNKSEFRMISLAKKKPPESVFPLANMNFPVSENGKARIGRLSWTPKAEVESYKVEVARDREFKSVVHEEVSKKTYVNSLDLTQGNYYWRVKADDKDSSPIAGMWSRPQSFTVGSAQLNVVDLSQPSTPFLEEQELNLASLDKAESATDSESKPETKTADIDEKPNVPEYDKSPPKLAKNGAVTTLSVKSGADPRNPAAVSFSILNPPQLKWLKQEGIKDYEVQLSKSKAFKSLVDKASVSGTNFKWKNAQPGQYYWRVRAIGPNGKKLALSSPAKLKIRVPSPQIDARFERSVDVLSPDKLKGPGPDVEVNWKAAPMTDHYRLLFSQDREMKKIVKKGRSRQPRYSVSLPQDGLYFVKLAAFNEHGEKISSSKISEIDFKRRLKLKKPRVVVPEDGVTIVRFGEKKVDPLLLAWASVKHAKNYIIEFGRGSDFRKIINNETVQSSEYILTDVPEGVTFWRVRAQHEEFLSPWSKARSFELQSEENN